MGYLDEIRGEKPAIAVFGHWHYAAWFRELGIQSIMAGTFQGVTSHALNLGLGQPGCGFYIISGAMDEGGRIVDFDPRFFPFVPERSLR